MACCNRYDLVVVGAGPAGCMAARFAPQHWRILLVEASRFPRRKVCGGALNKESVTFLAPFKPPQTLFLEPSRIEFRFVDWGRQIFRPTNLLFQNTSREAFDAWLLSLVNQDVEIAERTRVADVSNLGTGLVCTLANDSGVLKVETRYVVAADGARSQLRRKLLGRASDFYMTVQDWVEPAGRVEAYFDCVYTRDVGGGYVYSYVMPKGDRVLVGSVFYPGAKGVDLRQTTVLKTLSSHLPFGSKSLHRERDVALKVDGPDELLLGEGRLLVAGEAAGLISPTSGEGISYALRSGAMCGKALTQGGDPLVNYQKLSRPLVSEIRRRLRKVRLIDTPVGRRALVSLPPAILSAVVRRL